MFLDETAAHQLGKSIGQLLDSTGSLAGNHVKNLDFDTVLCHLPMIVCTVMYNYIVICACPAPGSYPLQQEEVGLSKKRTHGLHYDRHGHRPSDWHEKYKAKHCLPLCFSCHCQSSLLSPGLASDAKAKTARALGASPLIARGNFSTGKPLVTAIRNYCRGGKVPGS
eukprot:scpid27191/ scgid25756/ 